MLKGFSDPLLFLQSRESGVVSRPQSSLLRDRFSKLPTLFRYDLKAHFGCVNAIEFSNHDGGQWIVSGGDDKRVLIWNVQKALAGFGRPYSMHEKKKSDADILAGNPVILKGEHHSNVFCLSFDNTGTKVFSGGNDEQVILHDIETGNTLDVFLHEKAVYSLSVDPSNSSVFASSTESGKVFIFDLRIPSTEDPFCLANYSEATHAVMYNPMDPRLIATANSKQGLALWDIRRPESCLLRYGGSMCQQSTMSVRFNRLGDKLVALRRRLPPVLYNLNSTERVCQFDHTGYYNSCTMKSCCFAGDQDQYIVSGSDDFNVYIWQLPSNTEVPGQWEGEAHMVLKGHRSIVNQVRFNYNNHFLMSSGVEKMIKVWTPFPMHHSNNLENSMFERKVYTHEDYINLVIQSGQMISHDYSDQSLEEDSRMLAFFDSLVQRELEGWSPDDSSLSSDTTVPLRYVQEPSSSSSSDSEEENLRRRLASVSRYSPQMLQSVISQQAEEHAPFRILDLDRRMVEVIARDFSRNRGMNDTNAEASSHANEDNAANNAQAPANTENDTGSTTVNNSTSVGVGTHSGNHSPPGGSQDLLTSTTESGASTSSVSITTLISNRRADYFAGIKRFEERAKKRWQHKDYYRRKKVKRLSLHVDPRASDSSSDSSSDDDNDSNVTHSQEKGSKKSPKKLKRDESSDSDDSRTEGVQVVQEMVKARKTKLATLQGLKTLRAKTVQEEEGSFGSRSEQRANNCEASSCDTVQSNIFPSCSATSAEERLTDTPPFDPNKPSTSRQAQGTHSDDSNPEWHSSSQLVEQDLQQPNTPPIVDTSEYHPSNGATPSVDSVKPSSPSTEERRTSHFTRRKQKSKRRHYRHHDEDEGDDDGKV